MSQPDSEQDLKHGTRASSPIPTISAEDWYPFTPVKPYDTTAANSDRAWGKVHDIHSPPSLKTQEESNKRKVEIHRELRDSLFPIPKFVFDVLDLDKAIQKSVCESVRE